jgi:hypothetical protein
LTSTGRRTLRKALVHFVSAVRFPGSDERERRGAVFLILLAAASVWLLSGVFVFMTILLAAWYHGRRERLEIPSRPKQAAVRAPRASAASMRGTEHSLT